MTMRSRHALTAAVLVIVLLGGCSSPPPEAPDPRAQPGTASPAGDLQVVDALGRTVRFLKPPERIVVAGRSTLTVLDAMYLFPEAADRVVALVSGRQDPGTFLTHVDARVTDKTVLEIDAGPEQIAPLHPDVVIMRSFMEAKLGRALGEIDIPVLYVDLETPDQYARDLTTLGQLFADERRAEEIRAFYESQRDYVEQRLGQTEPEQKPSVLLLQHSDQGGAVAFSVPAGSWMQTSLVEMAGGTPVWREAALGGGWTIVNLEQIAAWDPDVLLLVSYGSDPTQAVRQLELDEKWRALRAVEQGRIYAFPGDYYSWDQPDPRWILGLTWLAATLHPDQFSDFDVRQSLVDFFEQMYGMSPESIEASIVPALRGSIP